MASEIKEELARAGPTLLLYREDDVPEGNLKPKYIAMGTPRDNWLFQDERFTRHVKSVSFETDVYHALRSGEHYDLMHLLLDEDAAIRAFAWNSKLMTNAISVMLVLRERSHQPRVLPPQGPSRRSTRRNNVEKVKYSFVVVLDYVSQGIPVLLDLSGWWKSTEHFSAVGMSGG
ncbi:uncharacterized protein AB675_2089 [Cyphellophora attinorum]|uniref:Uncharacterized protein n=1 Tax=Cyphellophora attinorum TaxID=1664694 RepID=A0A0N1HDR1_9EURO|nr:uncharacterized protein AB675_2089 [Phialophora attinorum]KPI42866.1 hypothetical protein AB675_2089 [Phialophora attinorum]